MKILIINYSALPLPAVNGGAVENLIEYILIDNENKKKHDYHVVSIFNQKAKNESKNFNNSIFSYIEIKKKIDVISRAIRYIINRFTPFSVGNQYIIMIRNLIDFNNYDAVIIENAPGFAPVIRKVYQGRLILHLHNDYLNVKTKSRYKILKSLNEVFSLSNYVSNRVKEIGDKTIITSTLYNGVDFSKFRGGDNDKVNNLRQKYKIDSKEIVLMFAGRLTPEKGVYELITAFNRLSPNKNLRLLIVGGTGYNDNSETKYTRKIRNIAKENVIFTGFVGFNEMQNYYSLSRIGIVPSTINEGFNLTIVEFLASGIPVIATNIGGMPEVLGDCGVLVDYDENFTENLSKAMKNAICKIENEEIEKDKFMHCINKFSLENYLSTFYNLLELKEVIFDEDV